jgi:hypothetical protein
LWGPETLHALGDLLILVEQATEPVTSLDVVRLAWYVVGEWSQGCALVERAVRPVSVEVVLVLADNGCGMSLVDD